MSKVLPNRRRPRPRAPYRNRSSTYTAPLSRTKADIPQAHLGEDLTEKQRAPPAEATKVLFPSYPELLATPDNTQPLSKDSFQHVYNLISTIKVPKQELSQDDLPKALHLALRTDVPCSELIPNLNADPTHSCSSSQSSTATTRLTEILTELSYSNSDAFREILRLPPPISIPREARQRVRLAHARKFFQGLERMSQYWDASSDDYYEVPDEDEMQERTVPGTDIRMPASAGGMAADWDIEEGRPAASVEPKMKGVYKGRRIGTGGDMPEDCRQETLRGLIEAVSWAYNCQVYTWNQMSRLAVGKMLLPVRQNMAVGRSPRDRAEARRGVLEGPVMVVQGRPANGLLEAIEGRGGRGIPSSNEVSDLMEEVANLLLLAQERNREGKAPKCVGEGEWWTSRPRWGGGPGGCMGWEEELQERREAFKSSRKRTLSEGEDDKMLGGDDDGDEEEHSTEDVSRCKRKEKMRAAAEPKTAEERKLDGLSRRWAATAGKWKKVEPGGSLWDKRMKYAKIGKPNGPDDALVDEIFMVSSMNHHVAMLKMRISQHYLDWLAGNESQESCGDANALQISRTKWFDLFNVEERKAFIEGLWGVMAYLMRNTSD